ncbi:DEHA2F25366p [Debaryomyces hansenii CBS767]|uniref:DEHA2F25366p n=1 Tax=Debaryomyces hansenii (strain ATCC 36239 / CBS 767 / BCRC 21394 / JCM 1990 / NBRC 0083 / IGC 2968) TaxID=284592 RepID=Q6BK28_DEBHA|nr:DEHA2F25366p [Debaryomyces hansenii CBS767]CAG89858.1 DEHA2F25366p [Debaryomyces hansenii CBS767]|eukprot:XP_461443.1 DEHA2F25366p [Debaryomyces hansenii CBS767]
MHKQTPIVVSNWCSSFLTVVPHLRNQFSAFICSTHHTMDRKGGTQARSTLQGSSPSSSNHLARSLGVKKIIPFINLPPS